MLSIKNLHASVEEHDILNGIDLEVKPGEVHAICLLYTSPSPRDPH